MSARSVHPHSSHWGVFEAEVDDGQVVSGVNPFYRTQEEVNFLFNQARVSVPHRFQKSSQVARSSQGA